MSGVAAGVDDAVAVLRCGRLVVYPTETVYGLGADATQRAALEALAALKGREHTKGLSVLVVDLDSCESLLAGPIPDAARSLAERFWPGPLTIVLRAAPGLDSFLVGPGGGVGLRCSSDPTASALVERLGRPITATSANLSGENPATTVDQARRSFGGRVGAYLDGGERTLSQVSSVVEFFDHGAILRRVGALSAGDLAAALPRNYLEN